MAIKEKFINGKRYILGIGGVWKHESKLNNNKENKMANVKGKFSNEDKKVIAIGILKQLREQYKDVKASDLSSIASTLYTIARKEANGKE